MSESTSSIEELIGFEVVMDTAGPVSYLGTLAEICPDGFWLTDADIRDRTEGHVSKERYVCEAKDNGIRANRRRIFVFREVVVSCSALDDVVID